MGKANAYSLFVSDVARRKRESGLASVNISGLYKQLGPEWQELSECARQRYKERAQKINENRLDNSSNKKPPTARKPTTQAPTGQVDPEPSSSPPKDPKQPQECRPTIVAPVATLTVALVPSSTSQAKTSCDTKLDVKPVTVKADPEPTAAKRPHEDDNLALVDPNELQQNKKLKPGIPNWKNIADKTTIDPIRYLDKDLFDLRKQCEDIIVARGHRMISIPIYTMSVNVLCKQKISTEPTYVPLEICLNAYSLKKGRLCDPYHVLIDAGKVPLNCVNEALDHSAMHKITFPPNSKGYPKSARADYKKIYKEMINFVHKGERTILVHDHRHLKQVRSSIEWLIKRASEEPGLSPPGITTWTILPIVEFVASMFNWAHLSLKMYSAPFFALHYMLRELLESSLLDYNTALMCEYHAEDDNNTQWCAKNCAQKMIMNIEHILTHIAELYTTCSDRHESDQLPRIVDLTLIRGIDSPVQAIMPPPPSESSSLPISAPSNESEADTPLSVRYEPEQLMLVPVPSDEPATMVDIPCENNDNQVIPNDNGCVVDIANENSNSNNGYQPTSAPLDPRLTRGKARPTCNEVVPMETEAETDRRPPPPAKKPTEKLIIASKGVIYEHPPDIY